MVGLWVKCAMDLSVQCGHCGASSSYGQGGALLVVSVCEAAAQAGEVGAVLMVGDFCEAVWECVDNPGLVVGGDKVPWPASLGPVVVGAADGGAEAQL